jgi:hypothetical protein
MSIHYVFIPNYFRLALCCSVFKCGVNTYTELGGICFGGLQFSFPRVGALGKCTLPYHTEKYGDYCCFHTFGFLEIILQYKEVMELQLLSWLEFHTKFRETYFYLCTLVDFTFNANTSFISLGQFSAYS